MTANESLARLLDRRDEFVAFARRRVPVQADAEDVVQQALMTAARTAAAVREEAALVPWFYQVVRSTLSDHLRAQARASRRLDSLDAPYSMPPHEVGNCACSVALLVELPASYVDILTRVDVLEEPIETAAAALGLTVNNATVRLHRARKALRDRLEACCGCKSAEECQSCACATGCV
ncbi:MAG: sigma-70 family RNA polymerase sigma factor [Myxococcales bacterium]|nr:sigma-70 family RNA polymerase sigma factor [Myxococcales bacterium]